MAENIEMKIKRLGGKEWKNVRVKFLKRILSDGTRLIDQDDKEPEKWIGEITVFCLSITHKKWIATDGFSTYIAEIFDIKTGEKLPKDFIPKSK